MLAVLLSPRFWGALGLCAAIYWAVGQFQGYGEARYVAGYNAYKVGVADQLKDLTKKTAALEALRSQTEAQDRENAIKTEDDIRRAEAASDALVSEIATAEFACGSIGGDFIRLYNLATGAAAASRPASN